MEIPIIEKFFRPEYYKQKINSKKNYVGLSPQVYFALTRYLDVYIFNIGWLSYWLGSYEIKKCILGKMASIFCYTNYSLGYFLSFD